MSHFALMMPGNWRPGTFLERGVAVPFTTPLIAQARCRPDQNGGVELIVPNPSGGDGNYVMPLGALLNFCTPSLHDQYLIEKLEELDYVTPAAIRMIASDAARQGFAGRLAAKSARQRAEDDESMAMVNYLILFVEILKLAKFPNADWRTFNVNDPQTRAKARACLVEFAPKIGHDADALLSELEDLSATIAFVGFPSSGLPSPAKTRLDNLRKMSNGLRVWQGASISQAHLPELVLQSVNFTIDRVELAIKKCELVASDIPKLLQGWLKRRATLRELFALPDWMLDGWPHICALWFSVEDHERSAQLEAIHAIAELLPLMPAEADKWVGADQRNSPIDTSPERRVRLNEDWRSGVIRVNSREHQEQLRAFV